MEAAPPAHADLRWVEEGVTDFRHLRSAIRTIEIASALDALADGLVARFPWLDSDERDDEVPRRAVYAGAAHFFGAGDAWTVVSRGDVDGRRGHTDPAWILDVLALAETADARAANEPVRGQPCRRYGFAVDLGRHAARVDAPPYAGSRPPFIAGEAWLDAGGRIRRVTWQKVMLLRPRDPRRPKGSTIMWETTELWDFGLAVDIAVPSAVRTRRGASGRLWRAVVR